MKDKLTLYIRSGHSGLYIVSHEEQRAEAEMLAMLSALQKTKGNDSFALHTWSVTQGVISVEAEPVSIADTDEPYAALKAFDEMPDKSILLMRDLHLFLGDPQPGLFRKIKDSLATAKAHNRVLVIIGCRMVLPMELEKLITVIDFALPNREQLREIMHGIASDGGVKSTAENDELCIDAARGLTTIEAENAFALSIVECNKQLDAHVIAREKSNIIRKNGLLEIVKERTSLEEIGGLENLKRDLQEKRVLFSEKARQFGLPSPRGLFVVGQPGTGKSLCAQLIGELFGIPLIRLDASKLFGSLVGQSEANWRSAFATVESMSPCALWIDEVGGLFCGAKSSGETDSGVTNRVIKQILQDIQRAKGIFFFFTENDIDGVPDPLIDRLDVFNVDLPVPSERVAIWTIHINKLREGQSKPRSAAKFNLAKASELTDGFSGRQIEQVWLKALNLAFIAGREPCDSDIAKAVKRFVPTSVIMKDQIEARRARLKNRSTPASAVESKAEKPARKLA